MGDALISYTDLDMLRSKIEVARFSVAQMMRSGELVDSGEIVARRSFALAAIDAALSDATRLIGRIRTPDEDGAA